VPGIGTWGSRFLTPPTRDPDTADEGLEREFDIGVDAHADAATAAQKTTTTTERVNGRLGTASPSGPRRDHV
jgi:hypothetical protein